MEESKPQDGQNSDDDEADLPEPDVRLLAGIRPGGSIAAGKSSGRTQFFALSTSLSLAIQGIMARSLDPTSSIG
jgi:hypothetical protein